MSELINVLAGNFSEELLNSLTKQIGADNNEQTEKAATGIMNTMVSALAKNASTPEGATSLANALDKDHDGSIFDDLADLMQGGTGNQSERTLNGAGIINHVLGDKQGGVINMISQISGLDSSKSGSLMTMLAPVIMGALGKTKRQQGLDIGGLTSLLNGTVTEQRAQDPTMGLITRFLDTDGDGSVVDDIANIGMKFLGGFLRRK